MATPQHTANQNKRLATLAKSLQKTVEVLKESHKTRQGRTRKQKASYYTFVTKIRFAGRSGTLENCIKTAPQNGQSPAAISPMEEHRRSANVCTNLLKPETGSTPTASRSQKELNDSGPSCLETRLSNSMQ